MTRAERIASAPLDGLHERYAAPGVRRMEGRRYSFEELVELRRSMVRYARSFPPGHARNQHRQTAMSLRDLLENEWWRAAHLR